MRGVLNFAPKLRFQQYQQDIFFDPAIAAYFLNANSKNLLNDVNTFGLLFESLVVSDLRIYSENLDAKLYHYSDHSGQELDAVIHFRDGNWGAIEVKLGHKAVDLGAENLLKFQEKISTKEMTKPAFLAVITAAGYAYKRKDGVYVVPITCLKN